MQGWSVLSKIYIRSLNLIDANNYKVGGVVGATLERA